MTRTDFWLRLERRLADWEGEIDELEQKARELRLKADKLRSLMGLLDELTPDIIALIETEEEQSSGTEIDEQPQETQFQRIAAFLMTNGNRPLTIASIETATGIPRASISAVLYRTHPNEFRSTDLGGPTRAKVWNLATGSETANSDGPSESDIPF